MWIVRDLLFAIFDEHPPYPYGPKVGSAEWFLRRLRRVWSLCPIAGFLIAAWLDAGPWDTMGAIVAGGFVGVAIGLWSVRFCERARQERCELIRDWVVDTMAGGLERWP